jgi:GSCFA family
MATYTYEQDGEKKQTSASFFRGENTNFHPTDVSLRQPTAIPNYVMQGLAPEEKFVTKDTAIVAFGSCFATNISNYLDRGGYNVLNRGSNDAYVTKLGDGMVNTYAILQQFRWAWENKAPGVSVWHGKKAEDFAQSEDVRIETKALFDAADLFIITLGLSELWYDEPTGEVFWRAVPKNAYDPERHKFRTATHAETLANLHHIYALVRKHRPQARILFTVSPIPLTATFRQVSCLAADAVSKATIRSALDEFLSIHGQSDGVYYFPSYEAVKRLFCHQWGDDRRHVRRDVLDFNMMMFEHYYCTPGIPFEQLQEAYDHAWELDIRKAEQIRTRPVLAYQEQRAKRKQAKIEARVEERRKERETLIETRKAERQRQKELNRSKSKFFTSLALKAAIALLALEGARGLSVSLVTAVGG